MASDPVIDAYEDFRLAVLQWVRFLDIHSPASPDFEERQAEVWYLNRIGELFRVWERLLTEKYRGN